LLIIMDPASSLPKDTSAWTSLHTVLWAQACSLPQTFIDYLSQNNISGPALFKLSEDEIQSIVKEPRLVREVTLNIACLKFGGPYQQLLQHYHYTALANLIRSQFSSLSSTMTAQSKDLELRLHENLKSTIRNMVEKECINQEAHLNATSQWYNSTSLSNFIQGMFIGAGVVLFALWQTRKKY